MAFYTANFLTKRRQRWLKDIHKVQAKVGVTYYDGIMQKKVIEGNDIVIHVVFSTLDSSAVTITGLRVYDVDGEIAADVALTVDQQITKATGQGVIFKIVLPIVEGAVVI